MTRGSYCQVVCNQLLNDCQFCLFRTPVFSTRVRLQIVVSSLDFKPATFWTSSCLQALHLEYRKNEVHAGRGEQQKKELSSCICSHCYCRFSLGVSQRVIYFWSLWSVLSYMFMLEVCALYPFRYYDCYYDYDGYYYFFIPFKGKSGCHTWIIIINK